MEERKHVVTIELDRFIAAAKDSRNKARDRCLMLLVFRHGLRISPLWRAALSCPDPHYCVSTEPRMLPGVLA